MTSRPLSHHRAYRSVHGGSLVFTYLLIVARHGHVTLAGYFLSPPRHIPRRGEGYLFIKFPCKLFGIRTGEFYCHYELSL